MQHAITIGSTTIPYQVRYSDVAMRKSIHVTPGQVAVVAPDYEGMEAIEKFVRKKRKWLFDAVLEIEEMAAKRPPHVQRYESGARLMYRGRRLKLTVTTADVDDVTVTYRTRFDIEVPRALSSDRPAAVKLALQNWMKAKCLDDAKRLASMFAKRLGVDTPKVELAAQKHMWGTCGTTGLVRINWRLVQAPVVALEYVVAHEICHLVERSHGEAFWALLSSMYPRWVEAKQELEHWEGRSG